MKKLLVSVLCVALLCCALCVAEEPAPAGGWAVNTGFGETEMPEEARAAFDAATDGLAGVGYVPVAYLGSQVVAGANYAFLCAATTVTAEPVTGLCAVIVYRDLGGSAEVLEISDVNAADYANLDGEAKFEALAGGWNVAEACGVGLGEDAQAAFDKAMEGFAGVGYEPLFCLGTQVVAGVNYAILCRATTVTAEPMSALAVVTVYADPEGGATVTGSCGFPVRQE